MKVSATIEGPAIKLGGVYGEIEIPDEEVAGLDDKARDAVISKWVEEEVNNEVQWGWEIAVPAGGETQ